MKTLFAFFAVFMLLLSASPASAWYKLVAKNGGPNGYDYSSYRYDEWGTSIWCEGTGYEQLPTKAMRSGFFKKGVDKYDQEAADYAFSQLRKGNTVGMLKMPSGRIVTWKQTSNLLTITVV